MILSNLGSYDATPAAKIGGSSCLSTEYVLTLLFLNCDQVTCTPMKMKDFSQVDIGFRIVLRNVSVKQQWLYGGRDCASCPNFPLAHIFF
jgi:hypothetical protein